MTYMSSNLPQDLSLLESFKELRRENEEITREYNGTLFIGKLN